MVSLRQVGQTCNPCIIGLPAGSRPFLVTFFLSHRGPGKICNQVVDAHWAVRQRSRLAATRPNSLHSCQSGAMPRHPLPRSSLGLHRIAVAGLRDGGQAKSLARPATSRSAPQ